MPVWRTSNSSTSFFTFVSWSVRSLSWVRRRPTASSAAFFSTTAWAFSSATARARSAFCAAFSRSTVSCVTNAAWSLGMPSSTCAVMSAIRCTWRVTARTYRRSPTTTTTRFCHTGSWSKWTSRCARTTRRSVSSRVSAARWPPPWSN